MRNARILARMVASTLAAAVLVAGMATAASATLTPAGRPTSSGKHAASLEMDTGW